MRAIKDQFHLNNLYTPLCTYMDVASHVFCVSGGYWSTLMNEIKVIVLVLLKKMFLIFLNILV